LPRAEARPLSPKEGMVVSVNRDGRIFIDQTPVSYNDFRVTFRSLVTTRKPQGVYLQADTRVPYGQVVRVLAIIRGAGIQNVGLVAAEEQAP
jgi:biopolymer transport protein TolR